MTESELLAHLFERLACASAGAEIIGAIESRQWPDCALDSLIEAEVLRPAQPAQVIECEGCEKNCFRPVHIRPAEGGRSPRAFIACDEPEAFGRIRVELGALEQWQITGETLARAVHRLLGFSKPPQAEPTSKRWILGFLEGEDSKGLVTLSIENGAFLIVAGQSIALSQVTTLNARGLTVDLNALLSAIAGDAREPVAGIGSKLWRKRQAKVAADARHSKPGGSRDVQEQIRALWATGKYASRDRCAEEECGALGISYSTARKALRGTPGPEGT